VEASSPLGYPDRGRRVDGKTGSHSGQEVGFWEIAIDVPQARFSAAAVTYPITTNQTWELLRFHSKLEKSSDEVEDLKDDRPIGPASERSTFWPGI
jgi:hypothetical protein